MGMSGSNDVQCLRAGNYNQALINIMGSGVLNSATNNRSFDLMNASGSHTGVINLISGGKLIANRVYGNAAGTKIVNFNGGILQANPDGAGTLAATFLQGMTLSTIYSNGAVIDSGTNVITIGQPLMAPVDYGITNITISDAGAGYIGAPIVVLSGGSGTGATAIAQVDLAAGTVTNILITSPGSGYQLGDTVTATLRYGGYTTPATLGTVSIDVNAGGGGLVKLGTGTLRLTATNTYNGSTTVSNGTLDAVVAGSLGGTTNITVEAGCQLRVESITNVVNDTATVDLKTGSTIYLANGVVDSVAVLAFDGTPQPTGIWGAPGNPLAAHTDARFTGDGLLLAGVTTSDSSWISTVDGNWGTAANWSNNIIAFGYNNTAYFTNEIAANLAVTQDTSLCIGNMTFGSPGAFNWTVSGQPLFMVASTTPLVTVNGNTAFISSDFTGTQGIAKSGRGTLFLNSTNTYSGITRVNNGIITIGVPNALPQDTILSLGDANRTNAGTFDLNGYSQTVNNLFTTSVGSNNATVTNSIINLVLGEKLNILSSSAGNNVTISEGTHLQVSGAGTLDVNTPNGNVLIWGRRAGTAPYWGMDLSQLNDFSAVVNTLTIGYDTSGSGASRSGLLALAATNNITAGTVYVGSSSQDGTVNGQMLLGQSNVLNVGNLHIGYIKAKGYLQFNSGITDGQLILQGTNGTRANVYLGEFTQGNSGTTPAGNMDITNAGCSVMAQINLLQLGTLAVSGTSSNSGGTGNLKFNGGIIDVNNIVLGSSLTVTNRGTAAGLLTMNGGILNVHSNFTLANGGSTTGKVSGIFIMNAGTTTVRNLVIGNMTGGNGTITGSVTLANGTLLAQTIEAGSGTATRVFSWNNGTIGNRDAANDLTISNLTIALYPAGIQVLSVDNGRSACISSILTNGGTLVKQGAGTAILFSNNTYSGSTIVSNGTLALVTEGTLGTCASVIVEAGARLSLGATGDMISDDATVYVNSTGKINIGTAISETVRKLYINGIAMPSGTYGATGSGAGTIDDVHFSGTGILVILTTDGSWITNGAGQWNTAVNWSNNFIPSGDFSIAYFTNAISADVGVDQNNAILDIAGLWFGSPTNNWGILNNTINLTNATGNPVVTVDRNIALISSVVTGQQGIVVSGSGILALSAENTYSGITRVNGGTLYIGADTNLGGSTLTLAGGMLRTTNAFVLARAVTLGTNSSSSVNVFEVDEGAVLSNNTAITLAGGTWVKSGAGTLALNYSGTSWATNGVVSNGTLTLGSAMANDGFGIDNGNIIVLSGGVLTETTANKIRNSLITVNAGGVFNTVGDAIGGFASTDAGGTINMSGAVTLRALTTTNVFNGTLAGAGTPLTITNVNQVLGGSNTYSGTTAIIGAGAGGRLTLAHRYAAQNSTVTNGVNNGLLFGAETDYVVGSLVGAGNFVLTNSNGDAVHVTFGGNNYNGAWNTGLISGSGSLTKTGSGQIVLGAANTFSGGFTLGGTGTAIPQVSSTGTSGPFGTGTLTLNGAPIRATSTSNITLSNAVIFAADTTVVSNNLSMNLEFAGPITLTNGTRTLTQNAPSLAIFSGIVGDNGAGYGLVKNGSFELVLTATNTYAGNTTINRGTIRIGIANSLPVTTILGLGNAGNTGSAVFELDGYDQTVAGLSNLGTTMTMVITNTSASFSTMTINNALPWSYGGLITTNINLVKTGAGVLTLASGTGTDVSTNTYIGTTMVTNGTLCISSNAVIPLSTNIVVYTNAQLTIESTNNVLGDSVPVQLYSGSKMYLTNGAVETVGALLIDGLPVPTGTWGTVNCQWTNTDFFAGSGMLMVTGGVPVYTIISSGGAGGTVAPAGTVPVVQGSNQNFTVTANANCHIVDVLVDGSSAGTPTLVTFTNVTADHTIAATFAFDTYTLTVSTEHGTAVPAGTTTNNWGSNIDATVTTPVLDGTATQYVCTGWTGTGSATNGSGTNTTIVLTSNSTLTWLWSTNYMLTIDTTNCSVNVTNGFVASGSNITVTVTPNANYHFVAWTGATNDSTTNGFDITLPMTNARAIAAICEIDMLTITASSGGNGTITPSGAVQVPYGGSTSFVMAADVNYHVSDVVVDSVSVGPSNTYAFSNVMNAHTITANFAIDTFTLNVASAHGATLPAGTTTNNWGSVIDACVETPVFNGTLTQYVATGWTGTGSVTAGSGTNTTFTITNNSTLTWLWTTNYMLTIGTTNCSVNVTNGLYGTNVVVTATPSNGHHFVTWTGDTNGCTITSNQITVVMDSARLITGVCEIDMFNITAAAGPNGSITPSGVVAVAYGSNQTFVITPTNFYHVNNVVVDSVSVGPSNSYLFANVTSNHSISATFAMNYTVSAHPTPEYWLNQYYGAVDYAAYAEMDTDTDGFFSWQEYICGTDPTNNTSSFKFIQMTRLGATNRIMWLGGNTNLPPFEVRRSTNLNDVAEWIPITNITRSADGTNYFYDPNPVLTNLPTFYRIVATNSP